MQHSHVGISVTDMDRSVAFYCDLLGMKQLCDVFPFGDEQFEAIMDIPGVKGRMCMLGNDAFQLELFEFVNATPKDAEYKVSDRGFSHFGMFVDDIDATYAKLRAADVRIHCPVLAFKGSPIRATYCRDPDGNVFEILESGQRS